MNVAAPLVETVTVDGRPGIVPVNVADVNGPPTGNAAADNSENSGLDDDNAAQAFTIPNRTVETVSPPPLVKVIDLPAITIEYV